MLKTSKRTTLTAVACWASLAASCAQLPRTEPAQEGAAPAVPAAALSAAPEGSESSFALPHGSAMAATGSAIGSAAEAVTEAATKGAAASAAKVIHASMDVVDSAEPVEAPEVAPRALPASTTPVVQQATPVGSTGVSALDPDAPAVGLDFFVTEEFKQRFVQSFLSVSDVEPRADEDEIEDLQEIMELIQQDSKLDRAMKKLQKGLNPTSSAHFPYLIGQLHQQAGRNEDALVSYRDAVEHTPNFRRAWTQIALLTYQKALEEGNENADADYREAARAFAKAIELGQRDELTYGMLAASLLNTGRVIASETAFRHALMMGPDNKQWAMGLAQCYFRGKRYGEAIALLDTLIEDEPTNAALWLLQGNAFLGIQETRKAARNFKIVDQLGAGTSGSSNLLADIYVNDGLSGPATATYLKALSLEGGDSPVRAIRAAKIMTGRGDLEEAKTLLSGLEGFFGERLPDSEANEMLKLRAKIAVREGRGGDEIQVLRKIVDRDPLDGDGLILLADALARDEQMDEALHKYEMAGSIEGFEGQAKLQHARALVKLKRYAEAVPLLKASLQLEEKESVRRYLESVEKAARKATN